MKMKTIRASEEDTIVSETLHLWKDSIWHHKSYVLPVYHVWKWTRPGYVAISAGMCLTSCTKKTLGLIGATWTKMWVTAIYLGRWRQNHCSGYMSHVNICYIHPNVCHNNCTIDSTQDLCLVQTHISPMNQQHTHSLWSWACCTK